MAEIFIVKTHKKNTGDVTFHSGGLESEQNLGSLKVLFI